jgi:Ca2+-binding RTX toxin-like protein
LAANEPIGLGTALPDWIEAPLGNHLISTGAGDDVIFAGVDASGVVVAPNPGFLIGDQPIANAGNQVIHAGAGNDYVVTGSGSDFIDLGDGNDIFFGSPLGAVYSVSDTILGGTGDDQFLDINAGVLFLDCGSGDDIFNDFFRGTTNVSLYQSATLLGGSGNDAIVTATPWKTVFVAGGTGNDQLFIDNGQNDSSMTLLGGSGDDVVITSSTQTNQTISIDSGSDNDYISLTSQSAKSAVINITAGSGDDYINNNGSRVDNLTMTLSGGSGRDFIVSYFSTATNQTASSTVTIDGGEGDDIIASSGFNLSAGIESGTQYIYGGSGNDTIISGAGSDFIYAGSGNDIINLRSEIVVYQQTLNFLNYGPTEFFEEYEIVGGGNDTVYLEGGADKVILGSTGLATIYGFGNNDFLDVTGLNATLTKSGGNTLIKSAGNTIGILKGYTGSVGLV